MKTKKQAKILGWICGLCLLAAASGLTVRAEAAAQPENRGGAMQCQLQCHSHTEQCRSEAGSLSCAYADYLVHTHEGICYDGSGDLRCSLPEITVHIHEEGCYGPVEADAQQPILWRQMLLCTTPEVRLHIHEEGCFRNGKWICGQWQVQQHRHSKECFSGETSSAASTDWLGIGKVKTGPFTAAGLLQIALGMGLLYLQTRWEREKMSVAAK